MGKRTVQTLVGWLIVFGHFALAAYIIIGKDDTWTREIKESAILTISPVTVTYVASVVKAWIEGQRQVGGGEFVNYNYAVVSFLIPCVLFLVLGYTIYEFPAEEFSKPEQLQQWLAASEVIFGGTVGFVISDLFKVSQRHY